MLTIIFVVSFILIFVPTSNSAKSNHEKVDTFNHDWHRQGQIGAKTNMDVSFPAVIDSDGENNVTVTNSLPPFLTQDSALLIKTSHQTINVRIEDKLVFTYMVNHPRFFNGANSDLWVFVDIPKEYAGKTVSFEISSPNNFQQAVFKEVLIGTKSALILDSINSYFFDVLLFLFTLICGVIFLIFAIALSLKKIAYKSFLYFSVFLFTVAIWAFTSSPISGILTNNINFCTLVSFFSLAAMPIPFIFLFYEFLSVKKGTLIYIISGLLVANFIINLLLIPVSLFDYNFAITTVYILSVVMILILSVNCFKQVFINKNRELFLMSATCFILFVSMLIDILLYYLLPSYTHHSFFLYGTTFFIIITIFSIIRVTIKKFKAQLEDEEFKYLALYDKMTGLKNRTSFEKDIEEITNELHELFTICLIEFDMNNLKIINDRHGHLYGDKVIKASARCISAVFSKFGNCYRVGGDEFVVILKNPNRDILDAFLTSVDSQIEDYNAKHEIKVNLAMGFAFENINPEQIPDLWKMFSLADAEMYKNKAKLKAVL